MGTTPSQRIRQLSVFIFLFALFLIGKLYFVQIVSGEEFRNRGDRQYTQANYDFFDRGTIFFQSKDGNLVSAATLKTGYLAAINPKLITDPQSVYEKLEQIIPLDEKAFFEKAARKDLTYREIARRLPRETAESISAAKLPGVEAHKERWRFYPGDSMAAQALGFLAYRENDLAGRYGLERYYEDVLGRDSESAFVNFFAEIFSNIQRGLSKEKSLEGDIVTSIEPSVEAYLEQKLQEVNETWNSEYSGGIIMNPMNGEIYAMALSPSFDPNNFQEVTNPRLFSNYLVESVYEMGSIIKPLTMAAGLDSKAVTTSTTYFDAGTLTLNNKTISNFDAKGRGTVNMQEVLNQSLNTGAAFVVRTMGKENFARYMLGYGLGEETGIDLPNETHGLVENLKSPRDIEYATAAFGQGIALTPIGTIRALAALGNGGYLVNPHIATRVNYKIGGSKKISPNPPKQVLKPETSEEITRMLVVVVDKALRGGTLKVPNYSIAAKTGTAQVVREGSRGYYDDRFLHSFFGYFPAYEPRFIVFLYTMYPKGVRFASETLSESFMDITKFLINYYEIPPDR
ncbi:penicillin-binding protein 2 [Patescibacteria group bacterium]|nr:MAG: penicillin-binding protein 2 [Patescibacteria group bacterium]